ncbi:AI-2E family transporter [Pseudactinotalea sp. Z1748]|uniref:AI-2E family transporter n=1 Tax=Pseudactinotalea sp. Z1748 TaxID=3413027 RepID=UPI003C7D50C4
MPLAPDRPDVVAGLERWGRGAWYLVGIALAVIIAYLGLSLISGLVAPLIVAAVIGALFAPLCQWLGRWVPRHLAALIVLVGLLTIGVGTVVVAVRGVIAQAGEIARQVTVGLESLQVWAAELGVGDLSLDDAQTTIQNTGQNLASGLGTVFSGTASLALGLFVGLFLLYFILADWNLLVMWTGRNLGLRSDVGAGVINDATWAMRRYFVALTASNIVSSTIVGVSVWVMGLPLAFPIAVVTMVTSYIPFLGAIFSGAFAVLVALGSGGITDAIIMLVIVLAAQNGVQTVIQTFITQGALKLHPILILGTTIAGGALFGILGAALSTPVFASGLKIIERLRDHGDAGPAPARR